VTLANFKELGKIPVAIDLLTRIGAEMYFDIVFKNIELRLSVAELFLVLRVIISLCISSWSVGFINNVLLFAIRFL
jgi:hypothetical protein